MAGPAITRSIPGGCLIGLGAIFSFCFTVLGAWGLWRWFDLPAAERHYDRYFWTMLGVFIGGGIFTVLVSFLAVRSLKSMAYRGYDPKDSGGPMIKW